MTIWLIEPRDPLIVREGRPFGPDPGARATSLPFPFPSTIAGGVRARSAHDENGIFKFDPKTDKEQINRLKELSLRGPLLVSLAPDAHDLLPDAWFVPAPADALLFPAPTNEKKEAMALLQQLVPLQLPEQAQTDLGQKKAPKEQKLLLVGQPRRYEKQKPLKDAPRYWSWESFHTWLLEPAQMDGETKPVSHLGLSGPVREQRQHVSMDADREAGKDGLLFGTSGLEFTVPGREEGRLRDAKRLALAVAVDEKQFAPHTELDIHNGFASFGGERRTVTWRKTSSDTQLPPCPDDLEKMLTRDTHTHCRIILLTPAYFEQGYYPRWLQAEAEAAKDKITVDIRAIAVPRPQVVSGWDLMTRMPKRSRRLAPAGTVLFLSLKTESDTAISTWITKTWMHCISDLEQDRRDGFGLAVVGTWSGQPVAMGLQKEAER